MVAMLDGLKYGAFPSILESVKHVGMSESASSTESIRNRIGQIYTPQELPRDQLMYYMSPY